MKGLRIFGITLGILYSVLCVGLYLGQNHLIFDPSKLSNEFRFHKGVEVEIPTSDHVSINSILISAENAKGAILYLHGNRGSNRRCLRQASMFEGFGYDILMPDYRGYGKTEGSIKSEKQLFEDAQRVYDELKTRYDESHIIIIGYSLGTGIASHLAAHNQPQHLVLLAPYESFVDLKNRRFPIVPDFLIKYPLNNRKHLESVNCPVTLIHGTEDEIIPFDSSLNLQKIKPSQIQLVSLNGSGHRGTIFHSEIRNVIYDLTKTKETFLIQ